MEPIKLTVIGGECSEILKAGIAARVRKLKRETPDISNCHVSVDIPPPISSEQGSFYVQLHVGLRNSDIFVGLGQPRRDAHEDPSAAVRHAFAIMEQHIREHTARQTDRAKVLAPRGRGVVRRDTC
jgi:ribosome-associated translation inhibitor RaiA